MKSSRTNIVIKIGTSALLTSRHTLNIRRIAELIRQVDALKQQNVTVTIITSGAVACGRQRLGRKKETTEGVRERQLYAAVGQVELMLKYQTEAQKRHLIVAQVLATKQDFNTRQHFANMQRCFSVLHAQGVIPIVNENDVVAVEELMFTDNDQLAGLIASMVNADALIILSDIAGLFDRPLDEKGARLLKTYHPSKDRGRIRIGRTSSYGRGGMQSKLETARLLSEQGIATHIADASAPDILLRIQKGECVGTTVVPIRTHVSGTRCCLARSADYFFPLVS